LRVPFGEFLARAAGLRRAAFGTALAHAGLGVTIAGIAGMSLASNAVVALKPGQSTHLAGYDWTLISLTDAPGPNYQSRIATLSLSRDHQPIAILAPERHFFPLQNQTVSDVAIRTNGFRDLYAVLGEERDGAAVLRLHYNPLAPWIWLGALIMAGGGALSLSDRRLRLGAPAPRKAPASALAAE
jgi:cytochrome c-type biogenesis protein CcmF